jgi:hypothetical protein
MRVWGVPMCALCDPQGSVRSMRISQHPAPLNSGNAVSSAGFHIRADEMAGASFSPRCRMLAAGVAVSVTVCLAWAGAARIMLVPPVPGSPVVRAMALAGFAGDGAECLQAPGRDPRRVDGLDLLRRGVNGLRQQVARAAYASSGPPVSPESAAVDSVQPADGATLTQASGSHRPVTIADAACLLTYNGFLVRHQPRSFRRVSIFSRVIVHTLAVRTPMPAARARLGHAKPIADGYAGGMQRPGAASADPEHEGIRFLSQIGPGRQDGLAGVAPPGVFSGIPPPGCVVPWAHRPSLVAGSPARCKTCGDISGNGGFLGCGDRASLPGRPARYRVIWLVCARCGATTPQLFYDERDLPLCASSADAPHGSMELQR